MKPALRDIAQAFVEICRELPAKEMPTVCDGVIALLTSMGLGRAIRTFPRLVHEELLKQENAAVATLTSPTGRLGGAKDTLVSALERALRKKVEADQRADRELIGGVLVEVGNERFDASVRGALDAFASALSP